MRPPSSRGKRRASRPGFRFTPTCAGTRLGMVPATAAVEGRIPSLGRLARLEPPPPARPRGRGLTPGLPAPFTAAGPRPAPRRDALAALVERTSFGFRPDEYERARALGYEGYLEEQLHPEAIDDSACEARLAAFPSIALGPAEIAAAYGENTLPPFLELKGATLVRAVYSRRQLHERVVESWSDHFSIDHLKDLSYLFKPQDDRRVARAHALGTFPELLAASARSEAMLYYLDNWLNFAGAPQENYARELLELHTLGVDGGYGEADVKEVARCFTGWTLDGDESSSTYLATRFFDELHAGGAKLVLGQVIPAFPPRHNATRVLELVGTHPSTARFVGTKLIRRFLTETPPPELVERVSATFLATGGDVRALLRVILARENLERSAGVLTPKFRRPFHLAAALLRALDAEVDGTDTLVFHLMRMGHSPFDWHPPSGYPDRVEAWGSGHLARWSFASELLDGAIAGVRLAPGALLARLEVNGPDDQGGLARRIDRVLFGGVLSEGELVLLQRFVAAQAHPLGWREVLEAIALAASLAGYQWF